MDKTIFYHTLDIDSAEEFKYYENMAALLETDEFIESNLVRDLVKDIDKESFAELLDSFLEELLKLVPDKETDLYITIDSIKRAMTGMLDEGMTQDDIAIFADEVLKFRKWFVQDLLAFDLKTGEEICVRDAIYNIAASKYLGQEVGYDFRLACDYELEGYDVRVADMLEDEYIEDYEN